MLPNVVKLNGAHALFINAYVVVSQANYSNNHNNNEQEESKILFHH